MLRTGGSVGTISNYFTTIDGTATAPANYTATNGWLVSARGLGSMISALMLAYWGIRKLRGRLWTAGSFVMPAMLFVFAWIRLVPLSLVALLGVGWGFMMVTTNSQAVVQSVQTWAHDRLVPLNASLEVTLACNIRCIHCYNFDRDEPWRLERHLVDELPHCFFAEPE